MKKLTISIMAACLFITASHSAFSQSGIKDGDKRYRPGGVLVKYKAGAGAYEKNRANSRVNGRHSKEFPATGVHLITIPAYASVTGAVDALNKDEAVLYAEPDYARSANLVPNDTSFSQLWGLNNTGQTGGTSDADIDAAEAWNTITSASSVIVAVADTGVDYNHPELSANIWNNSGETNCGDGVDNDANGYADDCKGWDFGDNDNDPMDYNNHGTHVSGTIAATGNNASGIAGVVFSAKIMPIRFLDQNGNGFVSDELAAIEYARRNGAFALNASFGGSDYSQSEKDAIDAFCASGGLIAAAAGNNGANNLTSPHYPASYRSACILSVGASNHNDGMPIWSNYGGAVDIAAPGESIYSTIPLRGALFEDKFDDGDISDWARDATNSWNADNSMSSSGGFSLADSPGANYANSADTWARSPAINLGGRQGCWLYYSVRMTTEASFDYLKVEASTDAASWTELERISGTISSFQQRTLGMRSFDGQGAVYVRFRLTSDASVNYSGANIDDVSVKCSSGVYLGTEYKSESGTSMAAPHAAGVAVMLKAQTPAYTAAQIKEIIMNSTDPKSSLAGLVATGGRLNANNALSADLSTTTPAVPSALTATASGTNIILSWDDNSTVETGYYLERKKGSSGAYAQIASLSADAKSYNDGGLDTSATYYYRVKAYNPNGESAYSNEASATTSAAPSSSESGGGGGGGGGCFIATAVYGSPDAPEVAALRRFRDNHLMKSGFGRLFVWYYYKYSPAVADELKDWPAAGYMIRRMLDPVVFMLMNPKSSAAIFILIAVVQLFLIMKGRGGMPMGRARAKDHKSNGGFTLIELVVVMLILALLAAVAVPRFLHKADEAKVTEAKVQIRNLESGLKLFKLDNGFYPATEQGLLALIEKPSIGRIPMKYQKGGYLESSSVPLDPWGYQYIYVSPAPMSDYEIISLGADNREGGVEFDADISSRDIK